MSKPLQAAQRAWIEGALDLVEIECRRACTPRWGLDDLRGAGHEALVRAALAFDPGRGVPFRAYARRRIRWALVDHLRAENRAYRRAHRAQQTAERLASLQDLPAAAVAPESWNNELSLARERARLLDMERWVSSLDEELPAEPQPDLATDTTAPALLEHLLRGIPPADRDLIRAVHLHGLTLGEYARRKGVSRSTMSRRHAAALRRLRALSHLLSGGGNRGM